MRRRGFIAAVLLLGAVGRAVALEVTVLTEGSRRPLAGAVVAWRLGDAKSATLVAAATGQVKISLPNKPGAIVHLTASKQGFTPMTMEWDADKVPAKFDLLLPEAQTMGGRVTDETGKAVAGASIALNLPQSLAGPRVALDDLVVKTQDDGRWRCDSVPKDAAYVFVEASHPDYVSPGDDVSLETLRAGTAHIKLYAVATVRGRVVDDSGRAVPDADLMLGQQRDLWPGNPETRSDAEGRFEFLRMPLQKRLLGARASGFAPKLQPVEIKREAPPVEIRLQRGTPLRVRVVDHAGQPLAGVEVQVNEWPADADSNAARSPGRWGYPGWTWETDAEGRFIWSNAPPEMASWSFTKGGYMSQGRLALKAAPEEQLVKLGRPFRVSGSVADAASGQPVSEFVITPRFVQTYPFNGSARTNFGSWSEYSRKPFTDGKFSLYYEQPLLGGVRQMHDWQFRVEADGYEPALSRILRDEERGERLDWRLQPRPLPAVAVAIPAGDRRVTAGVAVQPRTVRPGDTLTLFVKARIAPGHHIYALADSGCKNLPTSLDATLRSVLKPDGPWRSPEPKAHDDGSRTLAGEVLFKRQFLVERVDGRKTYKLPVTLRFQVCNEAVCWPAETISLETEFEGVTSPE